MSKFSVIGIILTCAGICFIIFSKFAPSKVFNTRWVYGGRSRYLTAGVLCALLGLLIAFNII